VKPISDRQAVLFDLTQYERSDVVKWGWLEDGELGTKETLVPNSPSQKLGTKEISVPNSPSQKLGTEEISVPNSPSQKLGTEESLVPNSPSQKLGTEESLVPNSPSEKLGTEESLVPNFESTYRWEEKYEGKYLEDWKPPIGGFDRKWSKNHQYWCWRYYDRDGKKRSIHLHKDYNKAVRKAIKIGVPHDAKLPSLPASDSPPTA
jgi:hypothetical protein